jgi:hypothetical protein
LGIDYYGHGLRQFSNLGIQRPSPEGLLAKLDDLSAIGHLATVVSRRLIAADSVSRDENPAYPTPDALASGEPDRLVDHLYLRNLSTQKLLAQQLGAFVLFVPQVLDSSRLYGKSGGWWTPHVRNEAMPRLIERLNAMMNEVCAPHETGCAVLNDVLTHAWDPDDFLDEGHFSPSGNEVFARFISSAIEAVGTLSFLP